MKTLHPKHTVTLLITIAFFYSILPSQSKSTRAPKGFETPESLVTEIYKTVSFKTGEPQPDWDKVRSMFLDNAVIVLRVSRDSTAILSVQGFIDDFVNFIEKSPAKQKGFTETIVKMKPFVFGNIAHILVLYEAIIPETMKQAQKGVDSWELVKKDGRWWIVAVTNEVPSNERPLPRELQD
jgi:hypothetical protein